MAMTNMGYLEATERRQVMGDIEEETEDPSAFMLEGPAMQRARRKRNSVMMVSSLPIPLYYKGT